MYIFDQECFTSCIQCTDLWAFDMYIYVYISLILFTYPTPYLRQMYRIPLLGNNATKMAVV